MIHEGIDAILIISSNRHDWLAGIDTTPFVLIGLGTISVWKTVIGSLPDDGSEGSLSGVRRSTFPA